MRFIGTIMIMLYHISLSNKGKLSAYTFGGYIFVDFFFIISGYLMANSMEKEKEKKENNSLGIETIRFLIHKAIGIFPFYFSAWLLILIINVWIDHYSVYQTLHTLLLSLYNIFMIEMAGNYDMGLRIQGSWYISAMLIAIFILYPIRKRYKDMFDFYFSPLLFLFFIGYVYQGKKGIAPLVVGFDSSIHMYNGLLRGIVEIALGCSCFRIAKKIKDKNFTKTGKLLITMLEWGGYLLALYSIHRYYNSSWDLILILFFAISISISFSQKGLLFPFFQRSLFNRIGDFSLKMYLMHEIVKNKLLPFHNINIETVGCLKYYLIFFLITFFCALICNKMGIFIKHKCKFFLFQKI